MFRGQGLRSACSIFSRPSPKVAPWPTFFKPNTRRTLLNASRDNRWPTSPILPEGKGFNWDAFRWTNYRVIGIHCFLHSLGLDLLIVVFAVITGGAAFLIGTKTARISEAMRNPLNNDWSTYYLHRPFPIRYGTKRDWENGIALLKDIVGDDNVDMQQDELERHGLSEWSSYIPNPEARYEPHVIVYPETTEQVSDIARVAHKYKLPIIPFSGGTSLEGHLSAPRGGICIDFAKMDRIIDIHEEDLDAIVQPGVGWEELNTVLESRGLWFPPDPGPGAKIGGMVGTGCSGTNAGRYGTMRDWVVNLTVVLADGTIIKTRQRPRKSSAGYDLTHLFIGSEGTLGIITEVCVKLAVLPQETSVAVVSFPTIRDAASTVAATVKNAIPVAAMELLDDNQMRTINLTKATARSWAEQPTLFIKFAGTKEGVKEQIAQIRKIAKQNNGGKFEFAKNKDEQRHLWSARKEALFSVLALREKAGEVWTTDGMNCFKGPLISSCRSHF